ncbi:unnamed protein product [Cylicocyclus nassatus]|uniref:Uncharacterized protein n=1 Tax=Cylicocyclus nassatus TaxID=53992 RepID=A0AA36DV53_CYLNA|nr:unnamed protein product [Cylicocyclus nassatus]
MVYAGGSSVMQAISENVSAYCRIHIEDLTPDSIMDISTILWLRICCVFSRQLDDFQLIIMELICILRWFFVQVIVYFEFDLIVILCRLRALQYLAI